MFSARPAYSSNSSHSPEAAGRSSSGSAPATVRSPACILPWKNSPASYAKQPVWLWPNLLSLDAPLIAVLWLQLVAVSGHVQVPPVVTLILALVVWLIYVADRLSDGLRADPRSALSPRHEFYRRHRKAVIRALIAVLGVTGALCLKLDGSTFKIGVSLMAVVGVYFAIVHRIGEKWRVRFPKEAAVALVFGTGTFFPAWLHAHHPNRAMLAALALFILICWLNLVLIEYVEWASLRGQASEMPHLTTIAAGKRIFLLGSLMAIAGLYLSACGIERWVLVPVSCSALALAALGLCWRKLSLNSTRVLADATLLTPAVALLLLHR